MSKKRQVDTKTWKDPFVYSLDPYEKLLWVYLLTNDSTNISGVYEILRDDIYSQTKIPKDQVENILKKFQSENKIFIIDDYICIKNFIKYQSSHNNKIAIGIKNELKNINPKVLEKFRSLGMDFPEVNEEENEEEEKQPESPKPKSKKGKDVYDSIWGNDEQYSQGEEILKKVKK